MSLISILALAAATPGPSELPATRSRYLMGTLCTGSVAAMAAPGEGRGDAAAAALDAAFDEIARLESILSDWRADSELSRLNRAAAGERFRCSADLFDFLTRSAVLSDATAGAFDITVGPLVAAWDLRGEGRRPSPAELEAARARVGWRRLILDPSASTATPEGSALTLDPGAIGKGYALDAALRILRARGVAAAWLDFGGQVAVLGTPPERTAWEIDIAHPLRRDEAAFTLELPAGSLSTSGNAERRPGHLLDPRTGRLLTRDGSVSVVAPTATLADAWSTALFVMGAKAGLDWIATSPQARRDRIEALFIVPDARGELTLLRSAGFPTTHPAARAEGAASTPGSQP